VQFEADVGKCLLQLLCCVLPIDSSPLCVSNPSVCAGDDTTFIQQDAKRPGDSESAAIAPNKK